MSEELFITGDFSQCAQGIFDEGHKRGFVRGWDAARLVIETLVQEGHKLGEEYPLSSALEALERSKGKAQEMLCTPEKLERVQPSTLVAPAIRQ